MLINAHNRYFKLLSSAWQPVLRRDGFGAFNAYRLEQRYGFASRSILLMKSASFVRVELWHAFNGIAVREVAFSPQSQTLTALHVMELSPDPLLYTTYCFRYGRSESEIRENVDSLIDAYQRFGRPFFRLE